MIPLRLPWEGSIPRGDGNDVPNVPSDEGRVLGDQLAELVDKAEPMQREVFPDMLPRCNDCALRAGAVPNQCLSTLLDVMKCAVESAPFYCHKGVREGEQPTRLCTGAMVLMSVIDQVRAEQRRERNARKRASRGRRHR